MDEDDDQATSAGQGQGQDNFQDFFNRVLRRTDSRSGWAAMTARYANRSAQVLLWTPRATSSPTTT